MRTFVYKSCVWLPRPLDEVFEFFADASNLEVITPPRLKFSVVTPAPIEMRPGTRIDYRLRFRGFPLRWRSEIMVWEPPHRFADVQVKGPYRKWIHEHSFVEQDGGTLAGDRVAYAVWGGALANSLVISRDVECIFNYREQKLIAVFGNGEAV